MQPMGRRRKRFPGKENNPKHRGGNWWEDENNDGNKAAYAPAGGEEGYFGTVDPCLLHG